MSIGTDKNALTARDLDIGSPVSAMRPTRAENHLPRRNTPHVFTIGYEKRNLVEFVELLSSERVDVLLDVRETAWSHKPGFSKRALSEAAAARGIAYYHAHWCGNPKWIRSVAESHEECLAMYREYLETMEGLSDAFIEFVSELLTEGRRVCLVCYERHPADCHRGILAELLESKGAAVVHHISPQGRRRKIAS